MNDFKTIYTPKMALILSICITCYWLLGTFFNPYIWAFLGAVFELLWLPMIVALFVVPIFSIIVTIYEKFKLKTGYILSILIPAVTFAILNMK